MKEPRLCGNCVCSVFFSAVNGCLSPMDTLRRSIHPGTICYNGGYIGKGASPLKKKVLVAKAKEALNGSKADQ